MIEPTENLVSEPSQEWNSDTTATPMGHNWFYQMVMLVVLGVYAYYLIYRVRYTINPNALLVSVGFYVSEFFGFLALAMYFFQQWSPWKRQAPPPGEGFTVDVFIPTTNEDISILRKTVIACLNMTYPHKTYILDDGCRKEVAALASMWGCEYMARSEPVNGKAGNLNHALFRTESDLVVVFDPDQVPHQNFLERTVGYFRDPKVGLVQTPEHFYNVDSFVHQTNMKRRTVWNEQDVFYNIIMPGKDRWNSAYSVGTGSVFRRTALEQIGGFAVETVTEDLHTSIRLHAAGWKSVYHNEHLSTGLAPPDITTYHQQQLRRAEGYIGVTFYDDPLRTPGLTLAQRLNYIGDVFYWLWGFPKLLFIATPLAMLFFDQYPILRFDPPFLIRYGVLIAAIVVGLKLIWRGRGRLLTGEQYSMLNFFVSLRAIWRYLRRKEHPRKVSEKEYFPARSTAIIVPQVVLGVICLLATYWGILKLYFGLSADYPGILLCSIWACYHGGLVLSAVWRGVQRVQRRVAYRFPVVLPARFQVAKDTVHDWHLGTTADFNEFGLALVAFEPMASGERVRLQFDLRDGGPPIECIGMICYVSPYTEGNLRLYKHGVMFDEISPEAIARISQYAVRFAVPYLFERLQRGRPSGLRKLYYRFFQGRRYRRRSVRHPLQLLLEVKGTGLEALTGQYLVTEDISLTGVGLTSHKPFPVGAAVEVRIHLPTGPVAAPMRVVRQREHRFNGATRYEVGLAFISPDGLCPPELARIL